jgi:hypothetical protein
MRQELATMQNVFVSGEAVGGFGEDAIPLEAGELYRGRADDAACDVLLYAENIFDLGVVCF